MRNNTDRGLWVGVSEYARIQIVYMKKSEQRMLGNGSFVRRNRSGGWEVTNRLYGAVGENSIDFLKILYRFFRKTL